MNLLVVGRMASGVGTKGGDKVDLGLSWNRLRFRKIKNSLWKREDHDLVLTGRRGNHFLIGICRVSSCNDRNSGLFHISIGRLS